MKGNIKKKYGMAFGILITTLFIGSIFASAANRPSTLIDSISVTTEQDNLPKIEFTEFSRDGWIIDKDECIYETNIELDGYIDESRYAVVDIKVGSTVSDSMSLSLEGKVQKVFIGWDLSNVNMENPETVEYNVGDQTVRRYKNADEMYALFVTFDKKERSEAIKPINRLGKLKEVLFEFLENHPRMFPLLRHLYASSVVEKTYGEMEVFKDGTGWIHGYYTIGSRTYQILTTLSLLQENLIDVINSCPEDPQPLLKVPYRSQLEFLLYGSIIKVLRGCGPACAAMMEEYYDGDHPNLNDIWNWRPVPAGGWTTGDIADYLNEFVDVGWGFTGQKKSGTVDECINYCKGKLNQGFPIGILMKSFFSFLGSNHWQVIRDTREDLLIKAFKVHDPFYRIVTELHYYDLGLTWPLYWPNTQSFEVDAWKRFGYSVNIVW